MIIVGIIFFILTLIYIATTMFLIILLKTINEDCSKEQKMLLKEIFDYEDFINDLERKAKAYELSNITTIHLINDFKREKELSNTDQSFR